MHNSVARGRSKILHVDEKVVTSVITKLEEKYGKMSMTIGRKHKYVGMNIIYNLDGTVTIDMRDYIQEAIDKFPETIDKDARTPAAPNLFEVRSETT